MNNDSAADSDTSNSPPDISSTIKDMVNYYSYYTIKQDYLAASSSKQKDTVCSICYFEYIMQCNDINTVLNLFIFKLTLKHV